MTHEYFGKETPHKTWFKKEQGRFLKKARLRAGLSVRDVARKTGVDIRWVESGEVGLQLRNLAYMLHLYRIPMDYFLTWERYVHITLQQMALTMSFNDPKGRLLGRTGSVKRPKENPPLKSERYEFH